MLLGLHQQPTKLLHQLTISVAQSVYTRKKIFEILLNETQIRLYLQFYIFFLNQTDIRLVPNQSKIKPS